MSKIASVGNAGGTHRNTLTPEGVSYSVYIAHIATSRQRHILHGQEEPTMDTVEKSI